MSQPQTGTDALFAALQHALAKQHGDAAVTATTALAAAATQYQAKDYDHCVDHLLLAVHALLAAKLDDTSEAELQRLFASLVEEAQSTIEV